MKKEFIFGLLFITLFSKIECQYCPVIDCSDPDGYLPFLGACFVGLPDDSGRLSKVIIGSCDPGSICIRPFTNYIWVNTDLQMLNLSNPALQTVNNSQFFQRLTQSKCQKVSSVIKAALHNGRSCFDSTTCLNRNCDPDTGVCLGQSAGSPCANHEQCNAGLACRYQTVWPYQTTCQPTGDVSGACDTDYDCKMRNFCWKNTTQEGKICMEKHNAPFGTQFFWDNVTYPIVNKTSVLFHGQYCQSGYAMQVNGTIAVCADIYSITDKLTGNVLPSPFNCTPNGQNKCQYKTFEGNVAFELTCECAMQQVNNVDIGFCPLPDRTLIMQYIDAIKTVWYSDGCHTFDRENYNAQTDCGLGNWDPTTLQNALDLRFQVQNYPWVQDPDISKCIQQVLPDASGNIMA